MPIYQRFKAFWQALIDLPFCLREEKQLAVF